MDDQYFLHSVAAYGSLELLKIVYEAYPAALQVNVPCRGTPLHYAAMSGDVEKVDFLYNLYPEAISQAADESDEFPLHFAVQGSVACLRKIYEYYPQAIRLNQSYPLHSLAYNLAFFPVPKDYLDMLRFLLKYCPEAAAAKDFMGFTPHQHFRRLECITSHRLLLRAAPRKNRKALHLLNYEARRGALYLLFAAELPSLVPIAISSSPVATGTAADPALAVPVQDGVDVEGRVSISASTTRTKRSSRRRGIDSEKKSKSVTAASAMTQDITIWRLLKARGDRELLREIVLFL
jgi:hypothetical protein